MYTVDIAAHERQRRTPPERQQHAEREAQDDRADGEEEVQHEPFPLVEPDGGRRGTKKSTTGTAASSEARARPLTADVGRRPTEPTNRATAGTSAAASASPTVIHGPMWSSARAGAE